jgi:hypothetical protein
VRAAAQPFRRATLAIAGALERIDTCLRRWPVAGLSLLAVALALVAAMRASA